MSVTAESEPAAEDTSPRADSDRATDATTEGGTADRILAEALGAFAARGVEATSLDSVAAGIGVRKQTLLYWFPSKEALLLAVIDHAVAQVGEALRDAVLAAPATGIEAKLSAAVDATFRLGRTRPELLALVREIARVGRPALTHFGEVVDPLLSGAAEAIASATPEITAEQARVVLVEMGARVVGLATEAELLEALGQPPELAWLRRRRRALLNELASRLTTTR